MCPASPHSSPGAWPVSLRRQIVRSFFTRWPGPSLASPGLGRAIIEFQEWEIRSGRLSDDGGSRWWAAVNAELVADLQAMLERGEGPWVRYATSEVAQAQAMLWSAHQESIERGVEMALPLLEHEPEPEREFIEAALRTVRFAAEVGFPTHDGELGRRTRERYPVSYPADAYWSAQAPL